MLPGAATVPAAEKRRGVLLAFGPFTFDRTSRLLRRGEDVVSLPPRAVAVLELLLERAGDVVARQELIDTVWKDAFVTDTSLAEAVSFLRQALGDDSQSPGFIQTVHRRGYRFIAPVTVQAPAAHATGAADAAPPQRVSPSIPGYLVPWSIAVLSAATAAAALWHVATAQHAAPPVVRFEVAAPGGTHFDARAPALALAAGGAHLAWSGCDATSCRLYVRPLDRTDAAPLAGTEGAAAPFFSPDGRWIGYFAGGKLWKIRVGGGTPVAVADSADALGGAWTPDGDVIFAGARLGLSIVDADRGQPRSLTFPLGLEGEVRHAWPSLSADGTTLLFTIVMSASSNGASRIATMRVGDGVAQPSWKPILDDAARAQAVGREAIVFTRGSELAAIGFDPVRLGVFGTAQPVISGVSAAHGAGNFSVSADGALAYVADGPAAGGRATFVVAVPSPDGARIAAALGEGMRADIWIASLENGAATRLTHDGLNSAPVWTPDGRRVYFARRVNGAYELWKRDADGSTPSTRVLTSGSHVIPLSIAADGKTLLFAQPSPDTGLDIWMLPAAGGTPRPLVQTAFDETAATLSPDGRFLAYQSNESGRWDVYAFRLEDGRRAVVSADGGVAPAWDRDGLRIRYRAGAKTMAASLAPGGEVRVMPAVEVPAADPPDHIAFEAGGRLRFDASPPASRRGVVALSFDRELRHVLGPLAGPMPR